MIKRYSMVALMAAVVLGTASCSLCQNNSSENGCASGANMRDGDSSVVCASDHCSQYKKGLLGDDEGSVIYGVYKGTFPCADCGGKDIKLTISKDSTYCLQYKYQDEGGELIEENGTYSILDDSLLETITPSSGEKTYYKFVHGNLVLSDSLGTVGTGEIADLYILKKTRQ